ncbi:MAG: nickel-dependent lactate racemase [Treponema sp.]|jgi:nickel-dependent lactate racemase|nr:nickel-dependent lactate racemase [Treponema sp.]
MKLELPYLDRIIPVEFPDEYLLAAAEPNEYKVNRTQDEILLEALNRPYAAGNNYQNLESFLNEADSVLVIINDPTRPTPTETIIKTLLPVFERKGITKDRLTFFVATGAHQGPDEAGYRQILGQFWDLLKDRCIHHDARKEENMVNLGTTSRGTPVLINKRILEARKIIATGSVEPHYFAGFTGGRKAFIPGAAGYKTIEANHKLALSPAARSLALEGNPVHEDMMEAMALIRVPVFSLMTVLDKEQRIAAAAAGDLAESFYAAVETAKKIFCVPVPGKADIVISTAKFPMDIDLYQSQKAIDNGALALKDRGVLILVSSCRNGTGDETYVKLLSEASSPAEALKRIQAGYRLGYHKAAKIAEVSKRASIKAVTELPAAQLERLFIEKAPSLQDALDGALKEIAVRNNGKPRILILPDGCVTVPDPENRQRQDGLEPKARL